MHARHAGAFGIHALLLLATTGHTLPPSAHHVVNSCITCSSVRRFLCRFICKSGSPSDRCATVVCAQFIPGKTELYSVKFSICPCDRRPRSSETTCWVYECFINRFVVDEHFANHSPLFFIIEATIRLTDPHTVQSELFRVQKTFVTYNVSCVLFGILIVNFEDVYG